jgi:hypothetical protein
LSLSNLTLEGPIPSATASSPTVDVTHVEADGFNAYYIARK